MAETRAKTTNQGGESSSTQGLSSTALLRVSRELKEVTRDPPHVLVGLKLDSGSSGRRDETIDKDGRSVHRRGGVGGAGGVPGVDEDATTGKMLLVIRGPDGTYTILELSCLRDSLSSSSTRVVST